MLDENMLVGYQFRVTVEKTGRNLAPLGIRLWIWHWRAASTAKGNSIGRGAAQYGRIVSRYQIFPAQKMKILHAHADPRKKRRARNLSATPAMTQFKRPHGSFDFEAHATA
jgi:hypothetical protein